MHIQEFQLKSSKGKLSFVLTDNQVTIICAQKYHILQLCAFFFVKNRLTLFQTSHGFYVSPVQVIGKHCRKRGNCT